MIKIGIIIGSTRPGRVGESVSRWVFQIAQERKDAEFELVDIERLLEQFHKAFGAWDFRVELFLH